MVVQQVGSQFCPVVPEPFKMTVARSPPFSGSVQYVVKQTYKKIKVERGTLLNITVFQVNTS